MSVGTATPGGSAAAAAANNLRIGTGFDALTRGWNGSVADLRIYSGALTAGEVAGMYAVPEPSTYGMLGAGALALVAAVRRRRKA